ncbi:MAG: flagellar biosynthesis anti-sigma factor FlgM [Actinomycetota bacterium]|nr:flagellar biosynthesis anti-sigma factor FlgM [Actinomycetota bacterium]
MRISDREIENSLRFLSQEPFASGGKPHIAQDIEQMVLGQLREMPDVRMDRVLSLRTAIQEKRYSVSSEDVAKKILGRCVADHIR